MSTEFCGLELAHPVVNGSGTFDALAALGVFGATLAEDFPFAAYVSKTITLAPRDGNPPPRLWETAGGLINSIGLPNRGVEHYMAEELPRMTFTARDDGRARPVPVITNVMGASAAEITELLGRCEQADGVAAVELNVSCPNVTTGLDIGADPEVLGAVIEEVRPVLTKPLIVKLTPNTADVAACAAAAAGAGADAVSLINTLRAMALAPDGSGPWLGGRTGGLSGPAIRAVALAQVAEVCDAVAVPVVGMGGVQSARHAAALIAVGAQLVAVGTETFRDPAAPRRIAQGLRELAPIQRGPVPRRA
ncbi:MAG TPA: dihydroorotate dehydrogenase [Solirubrobacteraceae bacterium]|nr:dihydroorotate dehydrogenase [Solirubrobacteraceae bacterium]